MYRSFSLVPLILLLVPDLALSSEDKYWWKNKQWVISKNNNLCLSSSGDDINTVFCDSEDKNQRWTHKDKYIVHEGTGHCVTKIYNDVRLSRCQDANHFHWYTDDIGKIGNTSEISIHSYRSKDYCLHCPWGKESGAKLSMNYCDSHKWHQLFYVSDKQDSDSIVNRRQANQSDHQNRNLESEIKRLKLLLKEKDELAAVEKEKYENRLKNQEEKRSESLKVLQDQLSNMEKEKKQLETEKNQLQVSLKDMKMKEAKLKKCVQDMRELKKTKF